MRTRIHGRDMGTHAPMYAQPIQVNWPSRTVALDVELVRHNIFQLASWVYEFTAGLRWTGKAQKQSASIR